ncbi:MAG TPA: MaoC family dehydratase N-terminal domain-containing protein [Streptosporangiaceae bacterium]|jgi:hydroxyacyl-ACP dehydratase HTD2-like protein with hotdog domain|nr:MaoC family dehydratase N-terminal domain-containing protein [Streptosporangiaceae bacterium]
MTAPAPRAPVSLDPATVQAGDSFGPVIVTPTQTQLFRFSAVTWNAHRIHYDLPYARAEGYQGILVQSHLHGCFLAQAVLAWGGPGSRLLRFSWQNRGVAVPGDQLACTGTVTDVTRAAGRVRVAWELEERDQEGRLCAPGTALLEVTDDQRRGG